VLKSRIDDTMGITSSSDLRNKHNVAVIFVKPHAIRSIPFIKELLLDNGLTIVKELSKVGPEVEHYIDHHYKDLSESALKKTPESLEVTEKAKEKFKTSFGEEWDIVLEEKRVKNLVQFKDHFKDVDVGTEWEGCDRIRIAPGAYVAQLPSTKNNYVINGFYLALRDTFVHANACLHFFIVQFEESHISWRDFRNRVIGSTNPANAHPGSIRNIFYSQWQELGLDRQPSYGENVVHASAGPIEAFRERLIWTRKKKENAFALKRIKRDPLGRKLLEAGISERTILDCLEDSPKAANGASFSAFDATENLNTSEGIQKLMSLFLA